ncbi:MAG TPA: DUF542 domain-containing protein [Longimicrobiales bacterium]|nr:DUF542 domain-containing protein [Longimicrobiales bacterium]
MTVSQLSELVVNEVIRRYPASVAVFARFGIDACCGGAMPVAEAAVRHGADVAALVAALQRVIGEDP